MRAKGFSRLSIASIGALVTLLACLYGGFSLVLFLTQDKLIYFPDFPSGQNSTTPEDIGLAFEDLALNTDDGLKINAWYVPHATPRATVLFCHGNAGTIAQRLETIRILHQLGLSVLLFDYRGYGLSEGTPSEQGTYLDAQAAWRYLTDTRGIPAQEIVIFGRSLGGAVAANLAASTSPRALVLESAFTSLPDIASEHYPWFPVRLIAKYRYETVAALESVHAPVLVIHSRTDEIIPFSHGERLFDAARDPKTFLEINGSHNGGYLHSQPSYQTGLSAFFHSLD